MRIQQNYLHSWSLLFPCVMLKIELFTSKLVNPTIEDLSIEIGGLKWNVCFGLVVLNFNVSCGLCEFV